MVFNPKCRQKRRWGRERKVRKVRSQTSNETVGGCGDRSENVEILDISTSSSRLLSPFCHDNEEATTIHFIQKMHAEKCCEDLFVCVCCLSKICKGTQVRNILELYFFFLLWTIFYDCCKQNLMSVCPTNIDRQTDSSVSMTVSFVSTETPAGSLRRACSSS